MIVADMSRTDKFVSASEIRVRLGACASAGQRLEAHGCPTLAEERFDTPRQRISPCGNLFQSPGQISETPLNQRSTADPVAFFYDQC